MLILRTISPSQLRDPEVLAEAAQHPINIFDAKRETELVLGPRSVWDSDQSLLNTYSLLLANAVVELPDQHPSAVALGDLGFAAAWPRPDRLWLLRQLAEVYAASVRTESTTPIVDFIKFFGQQRGATPPSRLAAIIEPNDVPAALRAKLAVRST